MFILYNKRQTMDEKKSYICYTCKSTMSSKRSFLSHLNTISHMINNNLKHKYACS